MRTFRVIFSDYSVNKNHFLVNTMVLAAEQHVYVRVLIAISINMLGVKKAAAEQR